MMHLYASARASEDLYRTRPPPRFYPLAAFVASFSPSGFPSPWVSPYPAPRTTGWCLCDCQVKVVNGGRTGRLTGVSLPVKVVLGVTVAPQLRPQILARRAVRERHVVVGNVVEKVDLVLLQHEASGDGVNRRVAPALVEEAAILVQRVEVVGVGLGPQPVQAANLKVGPLRAVSKGRPREAGGDARNDSGCSSRRCRRSGSAWRCPRRCARGGSS